MSISERIKFIRNAKKLSQEQMAENLCMSISAYSDIERGETDLKLSKLKKIAHVFELPLHELVDFREETTVEKSSKNGVCITSLEERIIESLLTTAALLK